MQAPEFWYPQSPAGARGLVWPTAPLKPLGMVYGLAGRLRHSLTKSASAPIPVICIGNLTLGGAGKTPVAIKTACLLQAMGATPCFLTRGYRGRLEGPASVSVDHTAIDVGDEAILLSRTAPVIVSRKRPEGAAQARLQGADVIVMDDGFQNPSLKKDFSVVVVDGTQGFGNGCIFPAGPLRESVRFGLSRADLVLVMNPQEKVSNPIALPFEGPVLTARTRPRPNPNLSGPLLAFAGIGRPEKFFGTLRGMGCTIAETRTFPDHHFYTSDELRGLHERAARLEAKLVTTSKDAAKLAPRDLEEVEVLHIEVVIEPEQVFTTALRDVLTSFPKTADLLSQPQPASR